MAALHLHKPWTEVKEMIKEVKTELTDEDLEYTPGNEEALLEHLAGKTNMTKEEVRKWIESVSFNSGKAS